MNVAVVVVVVVVYLALLVGGFAFGWWLAGLPERRGRR